MGVLDTLWTNAMIFTIILGSVVYNNALLQSGFTPWLVDFITGLKLPPLATILGLLLLYIPLGMFLEIVAMVLITVPVFVPVAISLGFDPVWFGAIILLTFEMAQTTPPFGVLLFVMKGVAPSDTTVGDCIRAAVPFLLLDLVVIVLMMMFPQITLWLPNIMR